MPAFGNTSLLRLSTCDARLIDLMKTAIKDSPVDFSIVCGHRNKEDQDKACAEGKSKTPFPTSKHNSFPSQAVDICPCTADGKADWNNRAAYVAIAAHVLGLAKDKGLHIRWGGDFHEDGNKTTNDAWDMPHFELRG